MNASDFGRGFLQPQGRVYLDAAATSLMPACVLDMLGRYYTSACANPHTDAHAPGRSTTDAVEASRAAVAELFGASPRLFATCFVGAGATGALNRAARIVSAIDTPRDLVVTTAAEHHSNLLPWLRAVGPERLRVVPLLADGSIDLGHLAELLRSEGDRVRAVACTAVSNVTGAVTDLYAVTRLAHERGALCVVDAAQAAPHMPLCVGCDDTIDLLALSGHKLYAPGSPGVLIGKRAVLDAAPLQGDVGGGMVDRVGPDAITWQARTEDREEAGTPNVPGILSLGLVCRLLLTDGLHEALGQHDRALTDRLLSLLRAVPGCAVYGSDAPGGLSRVGVASFNLPDAPHHVVARALDHAGFCVRNQCFCAQPYVRELLLGCPPAPSPWAEQLGGTPGMVRASIGPWTTEDDLERFAAAVRAIAEHPQALCDHCVPDAEGSWSYRSPVGSCFSLQAEAERIVSSW